MTSLAARLGRAAAATALAALAVAGLLAAAGGGSETAQQRADRISKTLRCPVCDGLSVADSPSSTARSMAADVRRRVDAGESDAQIRDAFIHRDGEPIVLTPRGTPAAVAVGGPVAAFAVAVVVVALALRRWARPTDVPPPTPDDVRVVAQLRAKRRAAGEKR